MSSPEVDYKKYLLLLIRRKELFVVMAILIMTVMVVVSFVLPRKYKASSTVFIEKNIISELVKGITVTPSMEDTIKVLTYAITSRSLLLRVVDRLDMNLDVKGDLNIENLITKLQRNINVQLRGKNLFIISFIDNDPGLSRDFVNTLVRLYIEENISSKRGESYGATKFLSEQIDTFKIKLENAEHAVNAYKLDKGGVISVDEAALFHEISVAQQKLYDLELRRRELEGMRQITKKSNDPLLAKLGVLQKRLDDLRLEYTDHYPDVIKVKNEMSNVKVQLNERKGGLYQPLDPQELEKIESEIGAVKMSEKSLRRYISSNQELLQNLPSAKAGLEKLELEKQNQKNIYDKLFSRHGQSEVAKQMEVQDKSTTFRVVDAAILPQKAVSPNRLRIMLMGIIGGIAASFGVLLLLDQKDDSVKGVDSAKEFGLPVLAVIPHIQTPDKLKLQHRRNLLFYSFAGIYFLFILCFPLMELLGLNYVDKLLDNINSVDLVQDMKGYLR